MKKAQLIISTVLIFVLAFSAIIALYIIKNGTCKSAGTIDIPKSNYVKLTPAVAKASLDNDPSIILLDVRTEEEYKEGHLPGSILIPDYELQDRVATELPDKEAVIFLYCRSGNRSKTAAYRLLEMGYTQVYDIGGIIDWPYEVITNGGN